MASSSSTSGSTTTKRRKCRRCKDVNEHLVIECPGYNRKVRTSKRTSKPPQESSGISDAPHARERSATAPPSKSLAAGEGNISGVSPNAQKSNAMDSNLGGQQGSSSASEADATSRNLTAISANVPGDRTNRISPPSGGISHAYDPALINTPSSGLPLFPPLSTSMAPQTPKQTTSSNRSRSNSDGSLRLFNASRDVLTGRPTSPMSRSAEPPLMNRLTALNSSSMNSPTSSSTESLPPSPIGAKRKRPSLKQNTFGNVTGVYRGTSLLNVARTRKRIKLSNDKSINAPKRFYDRTRALMTKLEDLAMETNCWIYFAAQFPTSQSPFIHYTSERLRNEGGDLMNNVHQASKKLFAGLMTARCRDTSQIAAQLSATQEELNQTKSTERAQAEEIAKLRSTLQKHGISMNM